MQNPNICAKCGRDWTELTKQHRLFELDWLRDSKGNYVYQIVDPIHGLRVYCAIHCYEEVEDVLNTQLILFDW